MILSKAPSHAFNSKCQCRRCVQLHTITMQDREFLRTMGIVWIARPNTRRTKIESRSLSTPDTQKVSAVEVPKT